jgi:hypothetical protein
VTFVCASFNPRVASWAQRCDFAEREKALIESGLAESLRRVSGKAGAAEKPGISGNDNAWMFNG